MNLEKNDKHLMKDIGILYLLVFQNFPIDAAYIVLKFSRYCSFLCFYGVLLQ